VSYRAYLVNGFDATGFGARGLRDGRQNGAEAAAANFHRDVRARREPLSQPPAHALADRARHRVGQGQQCERIEAAVIEARRVVEPVPVRALRSRRLELLPRRMTDRGAPFDVPIPVRERIAVLQDLGRRPVAE
jgi:hypothetical protein